MAAVLIGIGVSPGIAAGPVARMAPPVEVPAESAPAGPPEAEEAAALTALDAVAADLERRANTAPTDAAEVLRAQAMMALDPALAERIATSVRAGHAAVTAVAAAFDAYRVLLAAAGPYLAARVVDLDDLDDLRNRAVATLLGVPVPGVPSPGHPFVLVARDLAPADTATLDPASVLAIVTEQGGPTSHTAILAKSLAIPAVVACDSAAQLRDGLPVLVDGSAGTVAVAPTAETI